MSLIYSFSPLLSDIPVLKYLGCGCFLHLSYNIPWPPIFINMTNVRWFTWKNNNWITPNVLFHHMWANILLTREKRRAREGQICTKKPWHNVTLNAVSKNPDASDRLDEHLISCHKHIIPQHKSTEAMLAQNHLSFTLTMQKPQPFLRKQVMALAFFIVDRECCGWRCNSSCRHWRNPLVPELPLTDIACRICYDPDNASPNGQKVSPGLAFHVIMKVDAILLNSNKKITASLLILQKSLSG